MKAQLAGYLVFALILLYLVGVFWLGRANPAVCDVSWPADHGRPVVTCPPGLSPSPR